MNFDKIKSFDNFDKRNAIKKCFGRKNAEQVKKYKKK